MYVCIKPPRSPAIPLLRLLSVRHCDNTHRLIESVSPKERTDPNTLSHAESHTRVERIRGLHRIAEEAAAGGTSRAVGHGGEAACERVGVGLDRLGAPREAAGYPTGGGGFAAVDRRFLVFLVALPLAIGVVAGAVAALVVGFVRGEVVVVDGGEVWSAEGPRWLVKRFDAKTYAMMEWVGKYRILRRGAHARSPRVRRRD